MERAGDPKYASAPASQPPIHGEEDFGKEEIMCDDAGCVLATGSTDEVQSTPSLLCTLLSGSGWRLGMPPASAGTSFPALIGGDGFSFQLTQAELDDVVMALKAIRTTIKDTADRLASNTRQTKPLKVRWDTDSGVHLEATCISSPPNPVCFELTFHVAGGRPADGRWSSDAVTEMFSHLDRNTPH